MTSDFAELMRRPLGKGSHKNWDGDLCVNEKVSLLWAMHTGQDPKLVFSDLPACTNEVVARVAQRVNDALPDDERQQLNSFLPRLLRARRTDSDLRVNVRLAVWAARKVLHLVRAEDREVCERAVEAVEQWLADPSDLTAAKAAAYAAAYAAAATYAAAEAANAAAYTAYAAAANAATYTAYAAAKAAYAATNAAYAAAYAAATALHGVGLAFLDELLDQWEEAVTKEGEDLYVPASWEDEALAFVANYLAPQNPSSGAEK